jgi:hypothetical protein
MPIRKLNTTANRLPGAVKSGTMHPAFKNPNGVPNYPGGQKGASKKQVQDFVKDQVRRKGFSVSGSTSPNTIQLDFPGNARFFYGMEFENKIGTVTLMVNNEVVWQNMSTAFCQVGTTDNDYHAVNRPLSGQDDVSLTITGFAGYDDEQLVVIFK